MRGLSNPDHCGGGQIGVFASEALRLEDARLGCERLHERTEALFLRMARRDRTSVLQAALTAHFGADAARRAA